MSSVQCDYWGAPTPSESETVEGTLRKESDRRLRANELRHFIQS